jgi:hypothetical protein
MKGEAPYMVEFRWVYRPPIPFGLDPAAREALIRQRFEEEEIHDDLQTDARHGSVARVGDAAVMGARFVPRATSAHEVQVR